MKLKNTLLLALFCLCIFPAFSQQRSIDTYEFKSHWYMQLQGGAAYSVGEAKFSKLISPTAAVSVGYQLNPLFGIRGNVSGWQSKGGWSNSSEAYKFNYVQLGADATLNLSNLIWGYDSQRLFSAYTFLGAGVNYAFNNDEVVDKNNGNSALTNLWTGNKCFAVGRFGIGTDVRLSERVALNVEVNTNGYSDSYNSKVGSIADWQYNALVGFTVKFGKRGKTCAVAIPTVEYAPRVKDEIAPVIVVVEPVVVIEEVEVIEPVIVIVVEPLTENLFFTFNSSVIRPSEMSKFNELVEYLNMYPMSKITITGYADAGTGNAVENEEVSRYRAESVTKMLKSKGIAANRIIANYKGSSVQPFKQNDQNRVVISVVE